MQTFQILFSLALASPEAMMAQLTRDGAQNITLQRVQLDADPAAEAVIQFEMPGTGVHAVLLDAAPDGSWREAGRFNSWWSYTPADRERFLELRSTVDPGVNDLIVRIRSGGTEETRTTLEIHRLRNSRLELVFSVPEYLSAMEHPSGEVATTIVRTDFHPPAFTTVATKNPGKSRVCKTHTWNAAAFRFDEAPATCP